MKAKGAWCTMCFYTSFFPPLINQSVFSLPVPNPRQLLNQTRLNALSATVQCDVIRQRYAGEMLCCVIFLFFSFLFYYNWTMIRTCFFFISLPVKMCSFYRWCEWSPKKRGKKVRCEVKHESWYIYCRSLVWGSWCVGVLHCSVSGQKPLIL